MALGDVERNGVPNKNSKILLMYMDIANTITNLCLGGAAFAAIIIAQLPGMTTAFRSHVVLVTLGYLLMLTQAVTSINKATGWARLLEPTQRKVAHLLVELMGVVLVIAGTSVAVTNTERLDDEGMTSHGIMGLTALALTLVTTLGGVVHFFLSGNVPLPTKQIHGCFGCLALIVAFITFTMGLHFIPLHPTVTLISALAVIGLAGTISNAILSSFKIKI